MTKGVGQQAEEIVDAIIDNLTDRKGLRHEWDNIDEEIQAEIRADWMLIARRVIEANPHHPNP